MTGTTDEGTATAPDGSDDPPRGGGGTTPEGDPTTPDGRPTADPDGPPLTDGGDPTADPDGPPPTEGGDPTADLNGPPSADARVVVAQGTFDILHPGHLHYFREAAAMGDWLVVIIARRSNVTHKDPPVVPDRQRREMVDGLEPVDEAVLGHPEDIFVPIERIRPEVIALGHDQHHDPDAIRAELDRRGIDCAVERASAREPRYEGELLSTNEIVERILAERGD